MAEAFLGESPENLKNLYDVFKVLLEERNRRGAIDFETVETRMLFDPRARSRRSSPSRATTRTG